MIPLLLMIASIFVAALAGLAGSIYLDPHAILGAKITEGNAIALLISALAIGISALAVQLTSENTRRLKDLLARFKP